MARGDRLRRGDSQARYPTLAQALLDRRAFLAGVGAAFLAGGCYEDREVIEDGGARIPSDARVDAVVDSGVAGDAVSSDAAIDGGGLDGVPPPPDAGVDAETDASPLDASPDPDSDPNSDGAA